MAFGIEFSEQSLAVLFDEKRTSKTSYIANKIVENLDFKNITEKDVSFVLCKLILVIK